MQVVGWLFILALALGGAPSRAAASDAQPLAISIDGAGARATALPAYDPALPIDLSVNAAGGMRVDDVTVVAAGPNGESVSLPLARTADGGFDGTLQLAEEGAWRLELSSRTGAIRTGTSPVTIEVTAPAPSFAWLVGLGVGVAIFVIIGGSGFVLLRRSAPPTAESAGHRAVGYET
jgi:hypothetical protein